VRREFRAVLVTTIWMNACSCEFNPPHLGVKQVYPGRYHPDALVDLLDREKVSFSHCVPTILQMVLASAKTISPAGRW
jgi:fatty-acyl-CoA synthase